MDEVIEFINIVFQEMYRLERISRDLSITEAEGEKASEAVDDKYFHGPTHGVAIFSQRLRTPENFSRPMYSASKVKAPILFQIKEYDDAKWGKVYKAYASTTISIDDSYSVVYFIAKIDDQWKVISQYDFLSQVYEHRYGENFDHLKNPVKVKKLIPPADPADLEEYNSE